MTIDTIVTALLSSGTLTMGIIWLTKTWLSERLKQSISHEYAQLLEKHKAELASASALELERSRAALSQERAIRAFGEDYLREAARVAHSKRIEAIQGLWSAILCVTAAVPHAVVVTDYVTPEELAALPTRPESIETLASVGEPTLAKVFQDSQRAGEARLLAGEYLYSLYDAYRVIVGRAVRLAIVGRDAGRIAAWYQDSSVMVVMQKVFSPEEMQCFQALDLGRFTWLRSQVERKFVAHSQDIVSGEGSALTAVGQARAIEAETARLMAMDSHLAPNAV